MRKYSTSRRCPWDDDEGGDNESPFDFTDPADDGSDDGEGDEDDGEGEDKDLPPWLRH